MYRWYSVSLSKTKMFDARGCTLSRTKQCIDWILSGLWEVGAETEGRKEFDRGIVLVEKYDRINSTARDRLLHDTFFCFNSLLFHA